MCVSYDLSARIKRRQKQLETRLDAAEYEVKCLEGTGMIYRKARPGNSMSITYTAAEAATQGVQWDFEGSVATAFYSRDEWGKGKQRRSYRPDIVFLLLENRPTTF